MELAGQNIVVFDLETKNPCGTAEVGWNDHDKMGISVGVAFDFRAMDYLVYMDDNIEQLAERLNKSDLVVGFNILGFDIPLLSATLKTDLFPFFPPVYDILAESRAAVGATGGRPRGMKLDDHLLATFGKDSLKTEDGAQAPIFWQNGHYGRLVSYCIADVKREAKLFRYSWEGKAISTPNYGPKVLSDPRLKMKKQAEMAAAL